VWGEVTAGRLRKEAAVVEQERLLDMYRERWCTALLYEGEEDLRTNLLREVAIYSGVADLTEIEHRFNAAVDTMRREWHETVDPGQQVSIEIFTRARL
jgi:hypothetical protein